jgi:hypothetical protein
MTTALVRQASGNGFTSTPPLTLIIGSKQTQRDVANEESWNYQSFNPSIIPGTIYPTTPLRSGATVLQGLLLTAPDFALHKRTFHNGQTGSRLAKQRSASVATNPSRSHSLY